ncbi:MAG: hypothetical protein MUF62_03895 [Chitinophagaceae bacterium]|jgi:hypothetical protein|nr:hypothetical protein [Chitinophagaceae bacterium]
MLAFKKCAALLGTVVLASAVWAQPNYPVATPTPDLVAGEYFFVTDPGIGNATPISITAGTDLAGLNTIVSLVGVPAGVRTMGLRFRNADGAWGLTSLATVFKFDLPLYGTAGTTADLAGAEYFLNVDPGFGNATPLTLPAQSNVTDLAAVLNVASLPVGFHRVGIRTRNALGQWSQTSVQTLAKLDLIPYPGSNTAGNIVAAEYFIGTDPGLGNATALPIVPGTNIANANFVLTVPSAPAIYTLGIRTRDAAGNWSQTSLRLYDNLTAAAYPTAPAAPTALQRLEYFIDDDPGFGNATPITFTSSVNVVDLNVSIDLSGVAVGDHLLYIRSRNNPYSLTTVVPFAKGSALPVTWQYVRGEMRNDGAWLWWGTANEANTKHFVVEHSTDGRRFEAIGTVAAAGNSTTSRQYQFLHTQPAAGMHYYRIRQIDQDGRFSVSSVITLLQRQGMRRAMIAPNPVRSQLMLLLPAALAKPAQANVLNMRGQVLMRLPIAAGTWQLSANLSQLPAGTYRLQLLDAGEASVVLPFVKE